MSGSILVVYATRAGSTREVAEAVATTLRQAGLAVDIQPLHNVDALQGYHAVVMGAPLFMFRWHKDARGFLRRHRKTLLNLPVAVFALGPLRDRESEWRDVRAQLDKALAKFPWFTPTAVQVFGGKYDPAKIGFPWKLNPAMKMIPAGDIRDWQAIAVWANELAARFQPTQPQPAK
jgi:menaquinone-dependent protoporphyrinogen oxidase